MPQCPYLQILRYLATLWYGLGKPSSVTRRKGNNILNVSRRQVIGAGLQHFILSTHILQKEEVG